MRAYYEDEWVTLYHGDCRDILPTLAPVETCITDPPYGLEFMGRDWDTFHPDAPKTASERGDHMNEGAFPGTGYDGRKRPVSPAKKHPKNERCAKCGKWRVSSNRCRCPEPSWEYRNRRGAPPQMLAFETFCVDWAECVYDALLPGGHLLAFGGTRTFHRLTCAIEDSGFEIRDCLMWLYGSGFPKSLDISKAIDKADTGAALEAFMREQTESAAVTDPDAQPWNGWGTALKPAWEPIILAMRPLAGTFAQNAVEHGVAGLNVDGARIGTDDTRATVRGGGRNTEHWRMGQGDRATGSISGRWPANLALDEDAARMLDEQSGERCGPRTSPIRRSKMKRTDGWRMDEETVGAGYDDSGGASRFFYTSKASRADRGEGNDHPTVKPSDLMKWLCTLTATPTGGTVLDPFAGSGTTLLAAKESGRKAIGIEIEEKYCEIAALRCSQGVLAL